MPKVNKKIFASIFLFVVILFSSIALSGGFKTRLNAANLAGIGEERFSWSREVYDGVELNHVMSYNTNKEQKTYTLSFDPKTVNLKPIIAYGGNAMYGSTMTSLIDYEESIGNHVVFGINGDAYDTSNGVASGIVISEGELITSSNSSLGWGMLADGTIKYGSAALEMKATIQGGSTITLKHVNKERKTDQSGVYLLTERFHTTTESTESGVEVVLDIIAEHQNLGLKIGRTLSAKVSNVIVVPRNANKNKTVIGKNQVVLATHSSSPQYSTLAGLTAGTQIDFNINDVSDARIDWSEIEVGMGIFHLLMEDGVETSQTDNPDIHPRTSLGIKEDGSVVLMQNDGRQFGWAQGVSFKEMAVYMKSLGVVTLFNFDGGGSSTIQVTMPGNDRAEILNKPSDGNERANTNALLFIAKTEPVENPPVEKLHLYHAQAGDNATKALVLENSTMKFNLKATDNDYFKASLAGKTITYAVENEGSSNIGTITSQGVFTAASGTGKGKIKATVDGKTTTFDIEVVDALTSIETDLTILSIAPSKTIDLDFKAYNDNVPVTLSPQSLTFTLNPVTLGTVSSEGVFTSSSASGTGELKIAYKDFSFTLPVEVGKLPAPILDFETDIFTSGWNKYYTNIPANGGSAEISINRDERYIKHGDGSLRIDYDFATVPLTGTVAIEVGKSGNLILEGQPTAIGAWVYGDGNGGWFRIQLSGGKYAGDTIIDWVGWKYIETPIPTDAPFPYVVQRAVRLLGTASIGNNKKGTIYVDSVRAIYDFKNDDNDAPVVEASSISPAQGATTANVQQEISLKVKDAEGNGKVYTGINTSRTQMYINNKLVDNVQQTVLPDGSVEIHYNPGALDRLRPGVQNVRVRTEDNFGNKTFTEWSFTVEGYAVTLTEEHPDVDIVYPGQLFNYKILTPDYKNFQGLELEFEYNKNNLEFFGATIDPRVNVIVEDINTITGKVKIELAYMDNVPYDPDVELLDFKFMVKNEFSGKTGIKVTKSTIKENDQKVDLVLMGFDVEIDYKYILSFNGLTVGRYTTLKVVSDGKGVAGVSFTATVNGAAVGLPGLTDDNGTLVTDAFSSYPVGADIKIRATKSGDLSNEINFKIMESLGSLIPEKIVVHAGEDAATGIGIGFQTSHAVEDAKIVLSLDEALSNPFEVMALPRIIRTTVDSTEREYTGWGAYVDGLTPDTLYYYKVGSDAGWSEMYSFKTAKASGDYTIAYFGDIQGAYADFAGAVSTAYTIYPEIDLNIISGDVVDAGHIYSQWTTLDSAAKNHFRNGLWMSTIGNHDTTLGAESFTGFFYGPDNGVEEPYGGARNYWMEINDTVIFNFDTEAGFDSYDPGYVKQIALLKEVMANTTKSFRIVVMHRSAYPLNYNEASIRALAPVFEEAGVDLVLSGHDHVYSRTTIWESEKVEVMNGVTYVVAGTSSGAKFYSGDDTRPWVNVVYDKSNRVINFLKFRNGTELEFEAYALEGSTNKLIDSFTISKFEIDKEVATGVVLNGPSHAKVGAKLKYTLDVNEDYIVTGVTVDGVPVTVINNSFEALITSEDTKIVVQASELTGPVAQNIQIKGKFLVGEELTVSYDYKNNNNDPESGTKVEWYVEGVKVGEGSKITLKAAWAGKNIEVKVTAKSTKETGITLSYVDPTNIDLFGDLDGDGIVTKADAQILLDALVGKVVLTEEQRYLAGLSSGAIKLADVRKILLAVGGK